MQGVAIYYQDVSQLAGGDDANLVAQAATFGGIAGGGLDRQHRAHAFFNHEFQLAGVVAVDETAGVGAGDDADTFLDGQLHALNVNIHQRLGAHPDVGRADRAVEVVHLKGGREEGSLVSHHFEHIGVGGQVAAMLDGAGAGFDGDG